MSANEQLMACSPSGEWHLHQFSLLLCLGLALSLDLLSYDVAVFVKVLLLFLDFLLTSPSLLWCSLWTFCDVVLNFLHLFGLYLDLLLLPSALLGWLGSVVLLLYRSVGHLLLRLRSFAILARSLLFRVAIDAGYSLRSIEQTFGRWRKVRLFCNRILV